jgi:protein O-GlcNAc transferase
MNKGNILEAIGKLKQIVQSDPASGPAYFYLSSLYTQMSEFDIAQRYIERALETNSQQGVYYNQLGMIRYRQKNWRGALAFFQRALKEGVGKDEATVWRNIGDVEAELFERNEALEAYETALRIRPDDAETHLALGQFYLARNDAARAVSELKSVVEIAPHLKGAYASLGRAYRRVGDSQSAVSVLKRAVELDPADQESRYSLGQVLLAVGRSADGRRELETYERIKTQVDQANSKYEAAQARLKAGDVAEAEKLLIEAVSLAPSYGPALLALGTLVLDRGSPANAVELLRRASEANPLNSENHFRLGSAYLRNGDFQRALEATKSAIVLNEEDSRYQRQLEDIRRSLRSR